MFGVAHTSEILGWFQEVSVSRRAHQIVWSANRRVSSSTDGHHEETKYHVAICAYFVTPTLNAVYRSLGRWRLSQSRVELGSWLNFPIRFMQKLCNRTYGSIINAKVLVKLSLTSQKAYACEVLYLNMGWPVLFLVLIVALHIFWTYCLPFGGKANTSQNKIFYDQNVCPQYSSIHYACCHSCWLVQSFVDANLLVWLCNWTEYPNYLISTYNVWSINYSGEFPMLMIRMITPRESTNNFPVILRSVSCESYINDALLYAHTNVNLRILHPQCCVSIFDSLSSP